MKFTFTEAERSYMHIRLQMLKSVLSRYPLPSGGERLIFKMRDKFSPAAKVTYLGQKERSILMVILQRLMNDYIAQNSISADADIVQSLIDKVQI